MSVRVSGFAETLSRCLDFEGVSPEYLESALAEAALPLEMRFAEPSAELPLIRSGSDFTHLVFVQHGVVTPWQSPYSELAAPFLIGVHEFLMGSERWSASYSAMYRGVTTGLNEAFIIDNETKEALVAEDPKSSEIIKPVLRGRDIQRYRAEWAGKWLIATHNGYGDVPPVEIDDYPAIKDFLDRHYERLAKRYDKGRTPYNLRNCAYHAEFVREKLLWIELVGRGRFAYDESGLYPEATTFLMTGVSLKFLCAVLNSPLVSWFQRHAAPTSGMGTLRWKKAYVETIPVPQIGKDSQRLFVSLVDNIIEAQARDPNADTKECEQGIERLVFDLYGLTEDETRVTIV